MAPCRTSSRDLQCARQIPRDHQESSITASSLNLDGYGEFLFLPSFLDNTETATEYLRGCITDGSPEIGLPAWHQFRRDCNRFTLSTVSKFAKAGHELAQNFMAFVMYAFNLASMDFSNISQEEFHSWAMMNKVAYYTPGPYFRIPTQNENVFDERPHAMMHEPFIQYLCRSIGAAIDKGELMRIIARNPKNGESILDSVIADARFDKANTRLHLASSCSLFLQVSKACLRNTGCQASLELVDSEGLTPIMITCKCGNYEGVELLLEHGANAGVIAKTGETCLHYLCNFLPPKDWAFAQALVSRGATPSVSIEGLQQRYEAPRWIYISMVSITGTPLHRAVIFDDFTAACALLEIGADPLQEDIHHISAFELAITLHCVQILQEIVGRREIDIRTWANFYGNNPVVCVLSTTYNYYSMTVHLWDYFGQMKKIFDFLQDHGACWDKINGWGYSGLQSAVQHTTTNVVAHLLTDNRLKVLQCPNPANGIHNPLLQTAIGGNPYMVMLLLECGADVNQKDVATGYTCPRIIARSGLPDTVLTKVLISKGAKVDTRDFESRTPFWIAMVLRNFILALNLLKAGANPKVMCNEASCYSKLI